MWLWAHMEISQHKFIEIFCCANNKKIIENKILQILKHTQKIFISIVIGSHKSYAA